MIKEVREALEGIVRFDMNCKLEYLHGGDKEHQKVVLQAQQALAALDKLENNIGEFSDGCHTFNELYEHRHALFIALMKTSPEISWRANNHEDGSGYDGWFIAGMHLPTGDISYHLPDKMWELLDNANIKTSNCAPKWDGHTSEDVVKRLQAAINIKLGKE